MAMSDSNGGATQDEARRRLQRAIQLLHRSAGLPSARKISAAIQSRDDLRDTVSHETVSGILRGEGLPRWVKLECVVRVLAEWATHRPDTATVVLEVQELWLACHQPNKGGAESDFDHRPAIEVTNATRSAVAQPGLRVLLEEARISYQNGAYEISVHRDIRNEGSGVIDGYNVVIVVDRYPEEPGRSREHHGKNPLTKSELAFEGWHDSQPISWQMNVDRADRKEIRLLFKSEEGAPPLTPGSSASVSYSYRVFDNKWGSWFARRVISPTDQLGITADFPELLRPVVWGAQVDPLMENPPLHVPMQAQHAVAGRLTFRWQPRDIVLRRSYRLEWGFRNAPGAVPVL